MEKMYFHIEIEELEDKMWRSIVVSSDYTLAELGYLIMSIFNIYTSEYFSFSYDNNKYDCLPPLYNSNNYKSAQVIYLKDINFKKEDVIKFIYNNNNNKIVFNIKYLKLKDDYKENLPFIIDGAGKGVIDDVSITELKEIISETDSTGKLPYSTIVIEENDEEIEEVYDYRDFDLKDCNTVSLINKEFIMDNYEQLTLLDFLRVIKRYESIYYKSDIKEIVNPFDYMKSNLPDENYNVSDSESKIVRVPTDEEVKIYKLPSFEEMNHKHIMSKYVKKYIEDKDIRRDLFYTLRNYDYMDKFYDLLREYGLFKDYIDKTNYYYNEKLDDWIKENNIEI